MKWFYALCAFLLLCAAYFGYLCYTAPYDYEIWDKPPADQ